MEGVSYIAPRTPHAYYVFARHGTYLQAQKVCSHHASKVAQLKCVCKVSLRAQRAQSTLCAKWFENALYLKLQLLTWMTLQCSREVLCADKVAQSDVHDTSARLCSQISIEILSAKNMCNNKRFTQASWCKYCSSQNQLASERFCSRARALVSMIKPLSIHKLA